LASHQRSGGRVKSSVRQDARRRRIACSPMTRLPHRAEMMARAGLPARPLHRRQAWNRKPTGSCAVRAVGYVSGVLELCQGDPALGSHRRRHGIER
jgi:hypothetical protein